MHRGNCLLPAPVRRLHCRCDAHCHQLYAASAAAPAAPAGYQHAAPDERRTRHDVSGLSRGAELHAMLKAEVMLRRLKKDVLSQV